MAKAGRAAYRAAVVAAARGLRATLWQWLSRVARAEASEVGLAAVASAFPKFDAAPPPIGGRFITTKPRSLRLNQIA